VIRNTLPRVSEKAEQAAIIQLLESIGATVYKLGGARRRGDFPGTMQTPGLPDLFVFLPDLAPWVTRWPLWIEVKASGGKLRTAQDEFRALCAVAHARHIVGGLDDVIAYLTHGGWLK
jgi:hypothetical protein